jgi:hypothetical protein
MWYLALTLLAMMVWGSFFERWYHKDVMHNQAFKLAFDRHVRTHHKDTAPGHFYDPHDEYHVKESAVPLMFLGHLPFCLLIGWLTNWWIGAGTISGTLAYVLAYEFVHFNIHAPRKTWFQSMWLFKVLCELHRIHHYDHRKNYNVVCPLADWICRSLSLRELGVETSAPPHLKLTGPRSVPPPWTWVMRFQR